MRKTRRLDDTPAITLRQFTVPEQLCFVAAWHPRRPWERPGGLSDRWPTWDAYLHDFVAVRDELLARRPDRPRPLFGDLVLAYRRRHGAKALDVANDYQLRGELEPHDGERYDDYLRRVARASRDED